MTFLSYISASLRHYWRSHVALAVVVAVATAILTGALVIGDSVRLSLRGLALDRLGRVDRMMVTPSPFRAELAGELAATDGFDEHFAGAYPLLIVTASLEHRAENGTLRASNVQIVGYPPGFWKLARESSSDFAGKVVLTQSVATELGVADSDQVLLSLPVLGALPADSALGDKVDTTLAEPIDVDLVVSGEGFARFGLFATQQSPRTLFVPLADLQKLMQQPGNANTLVVATAEAEVPSGDDASEWLKANFRPKLADYGLTLSRESVGDNGYWQLASKQLVLADDQRVIIEQAMPNAAWQPVATYLANTITSGDKKIPYSLVAGVDSRDSIGPLIDDKGNAIKLTDDEIAMNDWAAERLGAKVGDLLTFTYYEPESTHGQLVEKASPELKVVAIVPLATVDGKPTAAADPNLTPELAGVTDEGSIADWDVPFELTEKIDRDDEDYWDDFRTTPKAFVGATLGQELFSSRWGSVSLLRAPIDDDGAISATKLAESLDPDAMGLKLLPAKAQALAAASGTTPFDALFFGFSMFLIASAIMLLLIVLQLVVAGRYRELGTLLAMGLDRKTVARLMRGELYTVVRIGAIVGVAAGVAYAALMIWGLTTIWVDAIAAPFISLHLTMRSLLIGLVLGMVVAGIANWWIVRRVVQQPAIGLINGREVNEQATAGHTKKWSLECVMLIVLPLAALAAGIAGALTQGEAQAGAFFASGASILVTILLVIFRWLSRIARGRSNAGLKSITRLSATNLYRKPLSSTLLLGIVAAAAFLLIAISAFRLSPTDEGVGGFDWIATTDQPLLYDLDTPQGQLELGLTADEERRLADVKTVSIRVSDGESASCLHLFKPNQPRVIGVPADSLAKSAFVWASHADVAQGESPWTLLDSELTGDAVPCVLDANTALYSLQLYGGVGSTFAIRDGDHNEVTIQVIGMLKNSVLQGDVIVSDANFRRLFPDVAGHRMFLIADGSPNNKPPLDNMLEDRLGDVGFDMVPTRKRLAEFLAVQNTYLSTFQTLGGLGLLLGTVGLAAVELRNLLARRGELALMRACGYTRGRLVMLVLLENLWLLVGGLVVGGVGAAVALVPPTLTQDTRPPVVATSLMLAVVIVVGCVASWLATRRVIDAPIVPALRGD